MKPRNVTLAIKDWYKVNKKHGEICEICATMVNDISIDNIKEHIVINVMDVKLFSAMRIILASH